MKIENINLKKLQEKLSLKIKTIAFSTGLGVLTAVSFTGCTTENTSRPNVIATEEPTQNPTTKATPAPKVTATPTAAPVATKAPSVTPAPTAAPVATEAPSATPAPTAAPVEEDVFNQWHNNEIKELNVESFTKFVDELELANAKAGLNLRRENLELATYINNIDLATPELIEKIESSYNYNEEQMINVYLQTMTSYSNDKLEFYNGEDTKCAEDYLMFIDPIDRETILTVDAKFDELFANISDSSNIELTLDKFTTMVKDIMVKNNELGINLSAEEVSIAIYQRNSQYASEEVKKYIETIKLTEGQTLETIDNNTLNIYKAHNADSKEKFDLSSLEYESYYVGSVVSELQGYMMENETINDFTKDQLTVGGLFTTKLKIDDGFATLATTGYANKYEGNITAVAEANLEACVARTYAVLGSKAALVNCEEQNTLTK